MYNTTGKNVEPLDHFLLPASLYASPNPSRVQTILGSCVAVCMFDTKFFHGGLNHFMLPWWDGRKLPSPRYGDVAIERLLEKMVDMGSDKKDLVAKIFGGSNMHTIGEVGNSIGDRNVATAEKLLDEHNIEIIARNTGGNKGRRIVFHTDTNKVFMKFLETGDPNLKGE